MTLKRISQLTESSEMREPEEDTWRDYIPAALAFWVLLTMTLIVLCVTPAKASDENTQLLASVRVGRWGGCSGTVFAADENFAYVASANHCIRRGRGEDDPIGQLVGICTVDGKIHQGEWIAFDDSLDLAVGRIERVAALGLTPIPDTNPLNNGNWTAVGYPKTLGPNLKNLGVARIASRTDTARGWLLDVKSGRFAGGDSGGGIFDGPRLIGVITHGEDTILSATYDQLIRFVAHVPPVAKAMGLPECPDGNCEVCPKCGKVHSKVGWKPEPNRPIVLPDKVPKDGTFPDKQSSAYIVELTKRVDRQDQLIAELQQAVAALQKEPREPPIPSAPAPAPTPQRGDAGPAGPRGPEGQAGPKPTSSELLLLIEQIVAGNRETLRGEPGPARTITVVLKWQDGTLIAEREVPPDKSRMTQILRKVTSVTK